MLQANRTCYGNRMWLHRKFPFVIANVLQKGNTVNTTGIWVIVVLSERMQIMWSVLHPTRHVMRTNKKFARAVYDQARALTNLQITCAGIFTFWCRIEQKEWWYIKKKHRCTLASDNSEATTLFFSKKALTWTLEMNGGKNWVEEDIRSFMALLTSNVTLTPSLSGNFSSIWENTAWKRVLNNCLAKVLSHYNK